MKNELNKKGFARKYCPGCKPRGKNCTVWQINATWWEKGLCGSALNAGNSPAAG
jgi:hypothetical protein